MQRHKDGQPNLLAPEGPGSFGWEEYKAELAGQDQDPVSISTKSTKASTEGNVTKDGKRSIHMIGKFDHSMDDDLSEITSVTTKVAKPEDKVEFPSMPPDFVINVYYDNFGDKAGHSELSMKVGVRGDAVEADRLHTKLFSALILSNSPYEAFRKFTQEHDLPYLSKLDE